MIIAVTGATGNMGVPVVNALLRLPEVDTIRILGHRKKPTEKLRRSLWRFQDRLEILYGNIASVEDCRKLVYHADYVINMAAVIPPASDKHPKAAIEANELGAKALVRAIEAAERQPKLIHISTVGLYGNRNHRHPFARCGDPLLISPFDIYAITKLRGEFTVLESAVKNRVVIRQTAMLYNEMLMKNVSDGLMFHTCFNAPLEWATGRDSGWLIAGIIRRDLRGELGQENFWNRCFNLGMEKNRITGFETISNGFRLIGGSAEDFFETNYNSTRNFHGVWFSDGQELEKLFHYQRETIDDFWEHVSYLYPWLSMAKKTPKKLIKKMVIERLLKDSNAPRYWLLHKDHARMQAYFGGEAAYAEIPKEWGSFPLLCKGQSEDGPVDYDALRKKDIPIDYGFDHTKPDEEITLEDLRAVAKAHGGRLLNTEFRTGDVYAKMDWETQDGEVFTARPYTVLRCGHWHNVSYRQYAWDFDRLSKKDRIYASVWLDSHAPEENFFYWYDKDFEARMRP